MGVGVGGWRSTVVGSWRGVGVGGCVRADINSKSIARVKFALIRVGISLDRARTLPVAPGVGISVVGVGVVVGGVAIQTAGLSNCGIIEWITGAPNRWTHSTTCQTGKTTAKTERTR